LSSDSIYRPLADHDFQSPNLLFQESIFRCHVSFRGCTSGCEHPLNGRDPRFDQQKHNKFQASLTVFMNKIINRINPPPRMQSWQKRKPRVNIGQICSSTSRGETSKASKISTKITFVRIDFFRAIMAYLSIYGSYLYHIEGKGH